MMEASSISTVKRWRNINKREPLPLHSILIVKRSLRIRPVLMLTQQGEDDPKDAEDDGDGDEGETHSDIVRGSNSDEDNS
ncbi:hypothetical protein ACFX11_033656 [Malus domestica]